MTAVNTAVEIIQNIMKTINPFSFVNDNQYGVRRNGGVVDS